MKRFLLAAPLAAPAAAVVGIHAQTQTRAFASVLPDKVSAKDKAVATSNLPPTPEGHLRPHYGIEVNPNHGLYAFFRKKEKDGKVSYETVEPADMTADKSGAFCLLACLLLTCADLCPWHSALPILSVWCGRSCVDGGRTEAEELQGSAHAVVCRAPGAEPACDAASGGEETGRERADSRLVGEGVQGMSYRASSC